MTSKQFTNIKQIKKNKEMVFLLFPIAIFPFMLIIFFFLSFGIFNSQILKFLSGFYFIFTIPLYPILIFPSLNPNLNEDCISNNLGYLFTGNVSIFILFAYFLRLFSLNINSFSTILFSSIIFVFSLISALFKKDFRFISQEEKSKRLYPKNFAILIVFLLSFAILLVLRFPILYGDDPWHHAAITNEIVMNGKSFPADQNYHNLFGLYNIGAFFHFSSFLSPLMIARWFPIISVLYGGFIGYKLSNYLIKNKQISIIAAIIFIITPLDFSLVLYQYWPTSLTVLLGLSNFSIGLNIRENTGNSKLYMVLFIFSGISMFFIHDFTAVLLFCGYFFVYLIQYLRNKSESIKMIILGIFTLTIAFILRIFNGLEIVSSLLTSFFSFSFYVWPIIIIGAAFAIIFLNKLINKPLGNDKSSIKKINDDTTANFTDLFYKKTFVKILFILSGLICIIIYIISPNFLIGSHFKEINFVINLFFTIIIVFISAIGYFTKQIESYKTDIMFFWGLYFVIAILGFLGLDLLFLHYFWWIRIVVISGGVISIGALLYISIYLERSKLSDKYKKKVMVISMTLLVLNSSFYHIGNEWYNPNSQIEDSIVISDYVPYNNSVFISSFRWSYPFRFFSGFTIDLHWSEGYQLFIENQTYENGTIVFWDTLNNFSKNNLYILLDEEQSEIGILGMESRNYGIITEEEKNKYYIVEYLNRIMISGDNQNLSMELYWFIN